MKMKSTEIPVADTSIRCPNCGTEIAVSEALGAQIRAELEQRLRHDSETRLKRAVAEAEQQARARAREESSGELKLLKGQLDEQRSKLALAQGAELALRKEKLALEERQRELDLEVQRRLDAAKNDLEVGLRKNLAEEHSLKLKEKEKQIDDLRKALEDAKRRSEQGSQELQGEVLELDIQAELERLFPADLLEPVVKGARGADIMQRVLNARLEECGSIVWETKNTKHWQPLWLDKLKEDQRAAGGSIAVLVSVVLPDGVAGFGRIDGVWVSDLKSWSALAMALREQLIQVAFARSASEGKNEKMELLYRYLAGDEFRHRVEAIVETFTAMQGQLNRERRAMEKIWREREKQIQRIITNTVGMYGEMRGIIGATMPQIEALELDIAGVLEQD